ncbi:hypothetical protein AB6D20_028060 (plasmid) [Vibrio splendidus]
MDSNDYFSITFQKLKVLEVKGFALYDGLCMMVKVCIESMYLNSDINSDRIHTNSYWLCFKWYVLSGPKKLEVNGNPMAKKIRGKWQPYG